MNYLKNINKINDNSTNNLHKYFFLIKGYFPQQTKLFDDII